MLCERRLSIAICTLVRRHASDRFRRRLALLFLVVVAILLLLTGLLSPLVLPHTLLIMSMVGCFISSLLLMFLAPVYYVSLYCGVAIMGFFVSWQFATGFSWTSHHMNITGKLSSVFFIGDG